jgi:hypothetical protein
MKKVPKPETQTPEHPSTFESGRSAENRRRAEEDRAREDVPSPGERQPVTGKRRRP